ncbi:hypothetical protein GUJ93_ZPchr0005g14859 [Zizania palustris]|uniref:Uncharacterized protein n=1 Tax=Zizania palustris TaxID=103762 RepID=A0A8J5S3R2_ZIZPA|nr:hypothetical protein GUJ93_ZPchr0005g14859 [Zizania palustris]
MVRAVGAGTPTKQTAERRRIRGVPRLAARKAGTGEPATTRTATWDWIRHRAAREEDGRAGAEPAATRTMT